MVAALFFFGCLTPVNLVGGDDLIQLSRLPLPVQINVIDDQHREITRSARLKPSFVDQSSQPIRIQQRPRLKAVSRFTMDSHCSRHGGDKRLGDW